VFARLFLGIPAATSSALWCRLLLGSLRVSLVLQPFRIILFFESYGVWFI
jgi:hypothetical protein